MNYTYMVMCRDGSLYTGWTNDLKKRLLAHNQGQGAKYTRSRLPVRLVYYEECAAKQEALKREYAIKRLSRSDKLALIDTLPAGRRRKLLQLNREEEQGSSVRMIPVPDSISDTHT